MLLPRSLRRFNTTNLRLRMISAAIMAPVALLAVYLGGIVFVAVLTCTVTIGLYEWIRLVAPNTHAKKISIACAMLVGLLAAGVLVSPVFGAAFLVPLTVMLFLSLLRDKNESAGLASLGIPYMGGFALALTALRMTPGSGAALVFYLFAVVWGTDVGAFAAGSTIGGPKLAPTVSPGKTWAGFFGGVLLATVLGYLAAVLFGASHPDMALVLSPLLAGIAQLGDLFESYFKRRSGVKESGDLIPGHGGVLDRIDGLVFAAYFAATFQAALGPQFNWW